MIFMTPGILLLIGWQQLFLIASYFIWLCI